MKKKKNIFILLILFFVVFVLYKGNFISKFLLFFNKGDIIDVNKLDSLKDSEVSFEEYSFDTIYYPYYGLLSIKEKIVYKQIYANSYEGENTFLLAEKIKVDDVAKIIEAVFNDHPELFWVNTNYSYKYTLDEYCVQITLEFNELLDDLDYYKSVFERSANTIINKAKLLNNDYEKEKYVHDTIIEMVEYDHEGDINQSAYSTLVNKKTVCAGYAKAFQYIMIKLGIPTYYVSGTTETDHAWNIIKLDDDYYNVDLTWADQERIIYNFFNVSDSNFDKTHVRSDVSKLLPKCKGGKYSNLEKTYPITNK